MSDINNYCMHSSISISNCKIKYIQIIDYNILYTAAML